MEEGKVSFYTGTSEQVLSSPINNGAFYLAKDTSKCSIYEQLVKEQFAREETDSTLCDLYEAMLSL